MYESFYFKQKEDIGGKDLADEMRMRIFIHRQSSLLSWLHSNYTCPLVI